MAKKKTFSGPLYATMVRDGWEFWTVWTDARDAYAGERPTRTGWVRLPDDWLGAVRSAASYLVRGGSVLPGEQRALEIAEGLTGASKIARGSGDMAQQAWEALGRPKPAGDMFESEARPRTRPRSRHGADPWWAKELGIALPTTRAVVTAAYQRRARETHPDRGGSAAAFQRAKLAHEAAVGWCAEHEAEE